MDRVVILGCGPAGLAAAQAVIDSGRDPIIISNKREPSRLYGCQYLHAPIPGYENAPCATVGYWLIGSPEEYRQKVYGDKWQGKVSPEDFVGEHDAWDIRWTYRRMWERLIDGGQTWIHDHEAIRGGIIPDCVGTYKSVRTISTIPATALCFKPRHEFRHHKIFANGSTGPKPRTDNQIICDGTKQNDWYRISRVFGYQTTEWATAPDARESAVEVPKPLVTDCDCHPEIDRVGRYGKWQKSYLVHQVYQEVTDLLIW